MSDHVFDLVDDIAAWHVADRTEVVRERGGVTQDGRDQFVAGDEVQVRSLHLKCGGLALHLAVVGMRALLHRFVERIEVIQSDVGHDPSITNAPPPTRSGSRAFVAM